jgi:hypothetical protein
MTFIFGELLKLVLVERLFSLTREKLMRIPAFARLYEWYSQGMAWLKATEAWRTLESETVANISRQQARASRVGFTNLEKGSHSRRFRRISPREWSRDARTAYHSPWRRCSRCVRPTRAMSGLRPEPDVKKLVPLVGLGPMGGGAL